MIAYPLPDRPWYVTRRAAEMYCRLFDLDCSSEKAEREAVEDLLECQKGAHHLRTDASGSQKWRAGSDWHRIVLMLRTAQPGTKAWRHHRGLALVAVLPPYVGWKYLPERDRRPKEDR